MSELINSVNQKSELSLLNQDVFSDGHIIEAYKGLINSIGEELDRIISEYENLINSGSLNEKIVQYMDRQKEELAHLTDVFSRRSLRIIESNDRGAVLDLRNIYDAIIKILKCSSEYTNPNGGGRINIEQIDYILYGRLNYFFRFIDFIGYIEDNNTRDYSNFGDEYLLLVNNINELIYSYFSGALENDKEKLFNEEGLEFKKNVPIDMIFTTLFTNIFVKFEKNISLGLTSEQSTGKDVKKIINEEELFEEYYKKYGNEYFKFKLTKEVLQIFGRSNLSPEF